MSEQNEEGIKPTEWEQFEAIGAGRTFGQLKIYIDENGDVAGTAFYDGEVLKAISVDMLTAAEAHQVFHLAVKGLRRALDITGLSAQVARKFFGDLLTEDKEDNNDSSKDTGSSDTASNAASSSGV